MLRHVIAGGLALLGIVLMASAVVPTITREQTKNVRQLAYDNSEDAYTERCQIGTQETNRRLRGWIGLLILVIGLAVSAS